MFYTTYRSAAILAFLSALGWILAGVFFLLNTEALLQSSHPESYWTYLIEHPNAALFKVLQNASLLLMGLGALGVVIAYRSILHAYNFLNDFAAICGFIALAVIMINASGVMGNSQLLLSIFKQTEDAQSQTLLHTSELIDSKGILYFSLFTIWLILINILNLQEENIPKKMGLLGIVAGLLILIAPIGLVFEIEILLIISLGIGAAVILPIWLIWSGIFFSRIEPASSFDN